MKFSTAFIKKALSAVLAVILTVGCAAALGGCGTTEHGRDAFTDGADSYYAALLTTFAEPLFAVDEGKLTEKLKAAREDGSSAPDSRGFDIDLTLTGLDSVSDAAGVDFGDSVSLALSGAANAETASGKLSLSMLGDTLNALASFDGEKCAVSLPQLLDRPIAFGFADMFAHEDGDADEGGDENAPTFDAAEIFRIAQTAAPKISPFAYKYFKAFVDNIPDSCFSNGEEEFRTADGVKKLDCVELSADGYALADALSATAKQLAADSELDGVFGEYAQQVRDGANRLVSEIADDDAREDLAKIAFRHVRFFDGDDIAGDSVYFAADGTEISLECGVSDGKDGRLAFLTLTDLTAPEGTAPFISAECRSGDDGAALTVSTFYDNTESHFAVSGKAEKKDGATVTTSEVKAGADSVTVKLFTLTATVRDCAEGCCDCTFELDAKLPAILVGFDLDIGAALNVRTSENGEIELIDAANALSPDDFDGDKFVGDLLVRLYEACPHVFELIRSGVNAAM